jgi:hypothetical protein
VLIFDDAALDPPSLMLEAVDAADAGAGTGHWQVALLPGYSLVVLADALDMRGGAIDQRLSGPWRRVFRIRPGDDTRMASARHRTFQVEFENRVALSIARWR